MRTLVERDPPTELGGVPIEEAPAFALLHVPHAFVHRPFRRDLYSPGVRLIVGDKRMQLTIERFSLRLIELAPRLLHEAVGIGIRIENEVLPARRELR